MQIVSIDVGITNLAIVCMQTEPRMHVTFFALVDITCLCHTRVSRRECRLNHGNSLCDRISHFVQEYEPHLRSADALLIEQQPPFGHQAVEQLLFASFRDKAHLVSPNAVHAFHNMRGLTYDERKDAAENRVIQSSTLLTPEQRRVLSHMERRHDICDAVCMALFWHARHAIRRPPPVLILTNGDTLDLEQFRYKPRGTTYI